MPQPIHPLTPRARRALTLVCALVSIVLTRPSIASDDASALVARADALYLRRGDGQVRGLARAEPIGEVVVLYERAAEMAPDDLEVTWKLLQALEYQGIHALPADAPERRPIFDRAKEVCESAIERVAAKVGGHEALDRATRTDLERRGIDPTHLAGIYLWGAFDTAAWARAHGTLAALLDGVPGRLHHYAKRVIALDPEMREGAGYRLLAQLHISVPRVPFVTGWVDPEEALLAMERAEEIAPGDPHNALFLAEVLLEARPDRREEAERLLRVTSSLEPRPDRVAEDWELKNKADELLALHYPS